jgi:serine/threonine protein kinase
VRAVSEELPETMSIPVATDTRIGATVDKYKFLKKLGEGGMGAVYEGEHLLIKRRVAIKCLHAHFAQRPDVVARFHREALAATQIGNEHIIEVTDMGVLPDGGAYLVLEMLEGADLALARERAGTMPVRRVIHIATQLCDALGAAHAKGIVHRDLKPENIFLISRGGDPDFVKVLDFGISKFAESADGSGFNTATGMALGTPYYMAPEQARDSKTADHRVDIYAIGVIIYHLLTGRFPIEADSFPVLMMKVVAEAPTPINDVWPAAPAELAQLIDRCLAKAPEDRFQDCASLKAALEPLRSVETRSVPPPAGTPQVDSLAATAEAALATVPKRVTLAVEHEPPPVERGELERTRDASTPDAMPAPPEATERAPTPSAPRSNRSALFGVAALVGLALVAVVIWIAVAPGGRPHDPETPPISRAAPSTGDPARENDSAPGRVRVLVVTDPADAELFLQGSRVANPFAGELPVGEPHRLEARAPGHASEVRELAFYAPQVVRLTLRAEGAPPVVQPEPPVARGSNRPRTPARTDAPTQPRTEAPPEPPRVETPPEPRREEPGLIPPPNRPTKRVAL